MNIVLIGMPGCGKSTVGVLLAKSLCMDFLDTDLLLQRQYGCDLCNILREQGLETFKELENRCLCEITANNCVIATGGSAVYGTSAMQHLKTDGVTVFLKLSCDDIKKRINNITTRGIAMPDTYTLEQLYTERMPLYERYADITIDCTALSIEACVERIKQEVTQ